VGGGGLRSSGNFRSGVSDSNSPMFAGLVVSIIIHHRCQSRTQNVHPVPPHILRAMEESAKIGPSQGNSRVCRLALSPEAKEIGEKLK
jgi:hypothetical protein